MVNDLLEVELCFTNLYYSWNCMLLNFIIVLFLFVGNIGPITQSAFELCHFVVLLYSFVLFFFVVIVVYWLITILHTKLLQVVLVPIYLVCTRDVLNCTFCCGPSSHAWHLILDVTFTKVITLPSTFHSPCHQ